MPNSKVYLEIFGDLDPAHDEGIEYVVMQWNSVAKMNGQL